MTRSRFVMMALLAAAVITAQVQIVSAQTSEMTCKVYALSDLGDDASLGQWIANTIPEMIQPGSWKATEGTEMRRRISYYAPSKILVVHHTAEVHQRIDTFLKEMKQAMSSDNQRLAAGSRFAQSRSVAPAQYTGPGAIQTADSVPSLPSTYPVPAQAKAPKHLFHFIIRYEGEGLIDSNVVKFARAMGGQNATGVAPPVTSYPLSSPPPMSESSTVRGSPKPVPSTNSSPITGSPDVPPASTPPTSPLPPAGPVPPLSSAPTTPY